MSLCIFLHPEPVRYFFFFRFRLFAFFWYLLLLNVGRQFNSETFIRQGAVLLQQAGRGGQHLHEEGVDVVLQVRLLPGLGLDPVLQVDDRLDKVLERKRDDDVSTFFC